MPPDIINELGSSDLSEFKKDFIELMRVNSGISSEYSKQSKDIDKKIREFKEIIGLFNKKYSNLELKLKQTPEELKLRIFIKEKSVKDIFTKVASRLNGLKSIGSSAFDKASIEESDKFSKELDKVKNKIFISYYEQEAGSSAVFLESSNKEIIELHYGEGIGNDRSPEFKLCAYYAVKAGFDKINIHEKIASLGFLEMPFFEKARKFLQRFNPKLGE